MLAYVIRRTLQAALLLVGVSLVGFILVDRLPGGPLAAYEANPEFRHEDMVRLQEQLGLDQPLPVRYAAWVGRLARGDFGSSLLTHQPVSRMIGARVGNTLYLMGTAFALSVLLAVPIGVLAAVRQYSWLDYASSTLTYLGLSIPTFWLGLLLITVFSVTLRWLPAGGILPVSGNSVGPGALDHLRHLMLPVATIVLVSVGLYARYLRAGVLEVLARDYVRTARAKGLDEPTILRRHVLKNALAPFVTVVALHLPEVVTGAVVTETIFSWPGMGRLFWESAVRQDHPVLLALLLLGASAVVVSSAAADVAYAWLNPRITLS